MNRQNLLQMMASVTLIVLLLLGCSAPIAKVTPTPATLAEIDLKSVLLHLGDLPGSLSPGLTTRAIQPWWFLLLPDPENFMFHRLKWNSSSAGEVALLLYESAEEVNTAYSPLVGTFRQVHAETQDGSGGVEASAETIADVGDRAQTEVVAMTVPTLGTSYAVRVQLAFVRCSALAHVTLDNPPDLDLAVAYARQVDDALMPLVCR